MPTDVNDLKDGQEVAIRDNVTCVDSKKGVVFTGYGAIAITDIITEWPPEPSADEAGWETDTDENPCIDRYEYRVQRRPIAPNWVPTVGDEAWWKDEVVTVNYIGENTVHVTGACGVDAVAYLCDLTQPKEGGQ